MVHLLLDKAEHHIYPEHSVFENDAMAHGYISDFFFIAFNDFLEFANFNARLNFSTVRGS